MSNLENNTAVLQELLQMANELPTDISGQAVLFTEQTLTDEQKEQARENIGVPDVITVTVDGSWNTSHSAVEIITAKNAGKIVILNCGIILAEVATAGPDATDYVDFYTVLSADTRLMKLRVRVTGNRAAPTFMTLDSEAIGLSADEIATVLGYTPADAEDVSQLSAEIEAIKNEEGGEYVDLTGEVEYTSGKYPTSDGIYVTEPALKTGVLDVSAGYTSVEITNVRCGGTAAIWCMRNEKKIKFINYVENKTYTVTIDGANAYDQIIFATLTGGQTPVVTAFKPTKYATKDDLLTYVKKDEIANAELVVSFVGTGFTTTDGGISNDADTQYSNWIDVKGGETIRITNALMNAYSCVQYQTALGSGAYQLENPSVNATFDYTLPRDAVKIRYSVLNGYAAASTVSYVTDYKHFREDFIPSLYVNGLGSRNDYPIITFVDDDGSPAYLDNVKPLLDQYGYKGTLGVITSYVGTDVSLTLEQLTALKADGYDIVSHSHSHANEIYKPTENAEATDEEIYNDLLTSKQWLKTNGFNSEWLVWPFGHYGSKMSRFTHLAIKAGYQFACDSDTGRSNNAKVLNTYWLDRAFINNSYALAKYTNLIDSAIANNGWLIISSHAGASEEMGDLSIFRSVVDYVHEQGVTVMTFAEASAIKNNVCSIGYIGDYSGRLYIGRDGKIYN